MHSRNALVVVGGKHCQFKGEAVMLFEVSSTESFYEARKWKSPLVSKVRIQEIEIR